MNTLYEQAERIKGLATDKDCRNNVRRRKNAFIVGSNGCTRVLRGWLKGAVESDRIQRLVQDVVVGPVLDREPTGR